MPPPDDPAERDTPPDDSAERDTPPDDPLDRAEQSHGTRGPIDRRALIDFRSAFERVEPLATGELDDPVAPTELQIRLTDGIGSADSARFDVSWTTVDEYTIHYTDSTGRNCRWDRHPHEFPQPTDDRHFHPPPDASSDPEDVESSCIEVAEVSLVARAVHALWRQAYDRGDTAGINAMDDPP